MDLRDSRVQVGTVEAWKKRHPEEIEWGMLDRDAIADLFGVAPGTVRSWDKPANRERTHFPEPVPRESVNQKPTWEVDQILDWGHTNGRIDPDGTVWLPPTTSAWRWGRREPITPEAYARRRQNDKNALEARKAAQQREQRQKEHDETLARNGWITVSGIAQLYEATEGQVRGWIKKEGFPPAAGTIVSPQSQTVTTYDRAAVIVWRFEHQRKST